MRSIKLFAAAFCAAALCKTCVPEQKTNVNLDPDFSAPETIELDFTVLNNDTIASFGEIINTPYTFITALSIDGDNGSKRITVNAETVDGANEEDAMHFASAVLRHMDDAAADQYPSFEISTSDSFGTLYDTYGVDMKIVNGSDGTELYVLNTEPGGEIALDPDIETYEEEWQEYMELYLTGLQDAQTGDEAAEAE